VGAKAAAPDIAHLLRVTDDYVRNVIHAFNERGPMGWTRNGARSHQDRSISRRATGSVSSPRPPLSRPGVLLRAFGQSSATI